MMGGINRLICVAIGVLACVCMWGCSDDKFQWEHFGGTGFAGDFKDSGFSIRCIKN